MKTVLCVDTADFALHFALFELERKHALFTHQAPVAQQWTHSALLVPLLKEALAQSHTALGDLSRVYLNIGPGSFTGLRASLSMVRCLGQFLPTLELYTVNRFQWKMALLEASHSLRVDRVCVGFDARRFQQYRAIFERTSLKGWQVQAPPELLGDEAVFNALDPHTLYVANSTVLGRYTGLTPSLDEATLLANRPLALWRAAELFEIAPTPWHLLDALYLQEPSITPNPKPAPEFKWDYSNA
jgi:tRNA threonylcarbamoyl adenosine modification protein YeaZ